MDRTLSPLRIEKPAIHRLGYAADIHLNFVGPQQRPAFYDDIRKLSLDGLLLVGDTSVGSILTADLNELAEGIQIPVWFTLGNHCWWHAEIDALRKRLRETVTGSPWLHWLDFDDPVSLADGVTLMGTDNWADEPWDHVSRKPKDWIYISDFVGLSSEERIALSRKLAEEAANKLKGTLIGAAKDSELVIIACHIPPRFPHDSTTTGECPIPIARSLVSFACGEAIASVSAEHPGTQFIVLSGHLHAALRWKPRGNVEVRVARAKYYAPSVEDVFDPVERVWLSQPSFEGGEEQ